MGVSKDNLYTVVLHGSAEEKQALLTEFKTHVKKDNVDLSAVPKYFETLAIAVDTNDHALQALAFSLICHLIKRVSIQNSKGTILQQQSFLVLPIVLPKIADAKSSTKLSAKRALEAYWLSAPAEVESAMIEIGLNNRSSLMVNESVVWLNHILTTINPHFKLNSFLDPLAKALTKHPKDEKLLTNIKTLFDNYYEFKHNRLHRFELQRVLEHNNVSPALRTSFMGTDSVLKSAVPLRPPKSTSSSRPETQLPSSHPASSSQPSLREEKKKESLQPKEHAPPAPIAGLNSKVEELLNTLPGYPIDKSIKAISVTNSEHLLSIISDMAPHFEHKESERNWNLREKSILKLRALLRGNCVSEYLSEYLQAVKGLSEGICKSLLSLRTTLTVNSSQFIKELAVILQFEFEPLSELFTPTLIKLCSNTKHLTNTNAHVAMAAIIATSSLTPKLLQKITAAAFEKNVNPRSFSAFWLRLYIIRSAAAWGGSGPESIDRILQKLLPDPNSLVRSAAKDAYWTYLEYSANSATDLLSRLDQNTVKALERSKPGDSGKFKSVPSLSLKRSRPSLKESIFSKNKELMSKQSLSRSNSRLAAKSSPQAPDLRKLQTPSQKLSYETSENVKLEPEFAASTFNVHQPVEQVSSITSARSHEKPEQGIGQGASDTRHSFEYPHPRNSVAYTPHDSDSATTRHSSSMVPLEMKRESVLDAEVPPSKDLDTFEHFNRSNVPQNFDKSLSPDDLKSHDVKALNTPSFEGNEDPIIKFLLSSQEDLLTEGISLMRYALLGDEKLSPEFGIALRKVSVSHPFLMKPLFEGNENLVRRLKKLLHAEDIIRVYCLLMKDLSVEMSTFLSIFTVDEVYLSVDTLLSYVVDLDNIMDDRNLVMQVIRYKAKFLESIMDLLNFATSKLPISDVNFTRVVSIMFDLVPIVYSTQLISRYQELLQKLYAINTVLFLSQLTSTPKSNKQEIKHLVGVDNILEYKNTDATLFNISELTKVAPGSSIEKLSPLKQPTEFSMVIPRGDTQIREQESTGLSSSAESKLSANTESAPAFQTSPRVEARQKSPVEDVVMEDAERTNFMPEKGGSQMSSGSTSEQLNASHNFRSMPASPNVFINVGDVMSAEKFLPRVTSDSSTGLADELAHVKLSTQANSIESFIEKVDPLSKISNRNKTISIFEDSKLRSPQKVREYSYTDLTWFNFSVAKMALDQDPSSTGSYGREEFWSLCDLLESCEIDKKEFASLILRLQVPRSHVFRRYLVEDGHSRLESALFAYLDNPESNKLYALLLLKQLLINRHGINRERFWNALIKISNQTDDDTQGNFATALEETFDEAFCGVYTSGELLGMTLTTFDSKHDLTNRTVLFALTCLHNILSQEGLALSINSNFIKSVDNVLREYLGHTTSEVRKVVLESYGRLLAAARTGEMTSSSRDEGDQSCIEAMSEILASVTTPQEKMIQFFSA